MKRIASFKNFEIFPLTKALAEEYIEDISRTVNLIPKVTKHKKEEILSEKKGERILYAKWEHSLITLTQDNKFVGIIIGYERESEANRQYPQNCIYLSEIAVAKEFQGKGLGKFLLAIWLKWNKQKGFLLLKGNLRFGVQTNKAEWNHHVQKLYEQAGFIKIAEKDYENRTDNVYSLQI